MGATGDPDWGEIVDRSIQIRADALDAPTIRSADELELAEALASIINEEVEQVSRLEIMLYRIASPGIAHGVGKSGRRVALLIELHRRLTDGVYAAIAPPGLPDANEGSENISISPQVSQVKTPTLLPFRQP